MQSAADVLAKGLLSRRSRCSRCVLIESFSTACYALVAFYCEHDQAVVVFTCNHHPRMFTSIDQRTVSAAVALAAAGRDEDGVDEELYIAGAALARYLVNAERTN